jgi:hypothetical protein
LEAERCRRHHRHLVIDLLDSGLGNVWLAIWGAFPVPTSDNGTSQPSMRVLLSMRGRFHRSNIRHYRGSFRHSNIMFDRVFLSPLLFGYAHLWGPHVVEISNMAMVPYDVLFHPYLIGVLHYVVVG